MTPCEDKALFQRHLIWVQTQGGQHTSDKMSHRKKKWGKATWKVDELLKLAGAWTKGVETASFPKALRGTSRLLSATSMSIAKKQPWIFTARLIELSQADKLELLRPWVEKNGYFYSAFKEAAVFIYLRETCSKMCYTLQCWTQTQTELNQIFRKQSLRAWLVVSDSQSCLTPQTVAHQAPLPMEFSRQGYRRGLLVPSQAYSWPRIRTCISFISCIGRWILYQLCHLGSPQIILNPYNMQCTDTFCLLFFKMLVTITLKCFIPSARLQCAVCNNTLGWMKPGLLGTVQSHLNPPHPFPRSCQKPILTGQEK